MDDKLHHLTAIPEHSTARQSLPPRSMKEPGNRSGPETHRNEENNVTWGPGLPAMRNQEGSVTPVSFQDCNGPTAYFFSSPHHHSQVEPGTDTFDAFVRDLKGHRKEERWKIYDTFKRSCCCPDCPSYNDCAKGGQELLYCVLGMSIRCIREDKHCTCPECPLYSLLGLSGKDFCMKGSEAAVRFERTVKEVEE